MVWQEVPSRVSSPEQSHGAGAESSLLFRPPALARCSKQAQASSTLLLTLPWGRKTDKQMARICRLPQFPPCPLVSDLLSPATARSLGYELHALT